jgi:hypothetical protein
MYNKVLGTAIPSSIATAHATGDYSSEPPSKSPILSKLDLETSSYF